ncbi:MAG: FUN14 domain-containing protein [Candidatus Muirbacterium halophilum]|nr:FUN14 domain-containing protein [Candidatus Muirbacterium halophilum]MCK9474537.1 FUN14 domain-containing protein [Candidatus Muirbacterium halophilum]
MKKFIILLILLTSFVLIINAKNIEIPDSDIKFDTTQKIDTAEIESAISNSFIAKLITMLGFGGLCGFVTGFALKKIARIFAVILGVIFISIQLFAFNGWISVDWNAISQSTDIFTSSGMSKITKNLLNILTTNLPFGSSFLIGLFMGFKKR